MTLLDHFEGFRVTILPKPKGQNLAEAVGFLAGHPAGEAQGRGSKTPPFCWRGDKPEPLPLGERKDIKLRAARGDGAAGYWEVGASGKRSAVAWRLAATGSRWSSSTPTAARSLGARLRERSPGRQRGVEGQVGTAHGRGRPGLGGQHGLPDVKGRPC